MMRYPLRFGFYRSCDRLKLSFTVTDILVDGDLSSSRLQQLLKNTFEYDPDRDDIFFSGPREWKLSPDDIIHWMETGVLRGSDEPQEDPPALGSDSRCNEDSWEFSIVQKKRIKLLPHGNASSVDSDLDSDSDMATTATMAASPYRFPEAQEKLKFHLLLACTGSIATVKLPLILEDLAHCSKLIAIHVVFTPSAINFIPEEYRTPNIVDGLRNKFPTIVERVWTDEDEWVQWKKIGDQVLHIELRKWADLLVIAPLSANSMARMVNGLVEGLLGGIVRAWDPDKEMIVAPAMNTLMWQHPLTKEHINKLRKYYTELILGPVAKRLACGDVGIGGMEDWQVIVTEIKKRLPLTGSRSDGEANT